jgi:hypothetical protein
MAFWATSINNPSVKTRNFCSGVIGLDFLPTIAIGLTFPKPKISLSVDFYHEDTKAQKLNLSLCLVPLCLRG